MSIRYWGTCLVALSPYNSVAALYALLSGSFVIYFGSKWSDFKSKKQFLAHSFSFPMVFSIATVEIQLPDIILHWSSPAEWNPYLEQSL